MIKAILVIVTVLLAWSMERLVAWFNSKMKESKLASKLTKAKEIVQNVVKKIYQCYVQDEKRTGNFSEHEKKEAKKRVILECKTLMNKRLQQYITKELSDLDAWLDMQIEATIYTLKNEKERAI